MKQSEDADPTCDHVSSDQNMISSEIVSHKATLMKMLRVHNMLYL